MRKTTSMCLLVACCVLSACGRGKQGRPAESQRVEEKPSSEPAGNRPDTAGLVLKAETPLPAGQTGVAVLVGANATAEKGFERLTFEFSGGLPGSTTQYLDQPPTQCGSGEVVDMAADKWLSIRLFPANAHTEAGAPTVTSRDQLFNGRNIKQLKLICDFEAVVEWVVAIDSVVPFRVIEQKAPDRLIIELSNQH